ncbi:hypothetical protein ED92_38305 [Amycolatopsis sp. MJM2582]|uniref:hypothetical protein n=1 Tax=Amycolatopsis sp. MJM2582 TaxID=1427749 RepID=UPI0005011117|nr:hypothetical protein [Amycolatopsis sp. MJM2582]KFZ76979.1 hypothetical protein ED92_38305 [Amycolatopsis sp. MJM2582]
MFAAEVGEGEFDAFSPANIAPLATADCPFTGKVFSVRGGAVSLLGGWSTVDTIETDGPWDPHRAVSTSLVSWCPRNGLSRS